MNSGRVVKRVSKATVKCKVTKRNAVWAYAFGRWKKGCGYSHVINASRMQSLIKGMEKRKLHNKVGFLAFMAHGDANGQVKIMNSKGNRLLLKPSTIKDYEKEIKGLNKFLTPNADVVFFSCISGRGAEGNKLLLAVSRLLRNRRVIGFITFLWAAGEYFLAEAGQVKDTESQITTPTGRWPANLMKNKPYARINSPNAKWAKYPNIIKQPKADKILVKKVKKKYSAKDDKELWAARHNDGEVMRLLRLREKQFPDREYVWPNGWKNK